VIEITVLRTRTFGNGGIVVVVKNHTVTVISVAGKRLREHMRIGNSRAGLGDQRIIVGERIWIKGIGNTYPSQLLVPHSLHGFLMR